MEGMGGWGWQLITDERWDWGPPADRAAPVAGWDGDGDASALAVDLIDTGGWRLRVIGGIAGARSRKGNIHVIEDRCGGAVLRVGGIAILDHAVAAEVSGPEVLA